MKCKACLAEVPNLLKHSALACLRTQESKRQETGDKCPVCGKATFHDGKCQLYETIRKNIGLPA